MKHSLIRHVKLVPVKLTNLLDLKNLLTFKKKNYL